MIEIKQGTEKNNNIQTDCILKLSKTFLTNSIIRLNNKNDDE